jgi:hypothetical protein
MPVTYLFRGNISKGGVFTFTIDVMHPHYHSFKELTYIDLLLKFSFNPVSYSGQLDLSVTQPRLGHERQLRRFLEPIPAPGDIKHALCMCHSYYGIYGSEHTHNRAT